MGEFVRQQGRLFCIAFTLIYYNYVTYDSTTVIHSAVQSRIMITTETRSIDFCSGSYFLELRPLAIFSQFLAFLVTVSLETQRISLQQPFSIVIGILWFASYTVCYKEPQYKESCAGGESMRLILLSSNVNLLCLYIICCAIISCNLQWADFLSKK